MRLLPQKMSLQSPSGCAHKSSSFRSSRGARRRSLVWRDVQIFLPGLRGINHIMRDFLCRHTVRMIITTIINIIMCPTLLLPLLFLVVVVVVATPRFHRHCNYLQNQSTCALCFYALTCVCVCGAHTKMLWAASLIRAHTRTHTGTHTGTQTMRTRWQLQVAFAKSPGVCRLKRTLLLYETPCDIAAVKYVGFLMR